MHGSSMPPRPLFIFAAGYCIVDTTGTWVMMDEEGGEVVVQGSEECPIPENSRTERLWQARPVHIYKLVGDRDNVLYYDMIAEGVEHRCEAMRQQNKGRCIQVVDTDGLCKIHLQQVKRGINPVIRFFDGQ